ncbi:MAG: hypothetical protein ABIR50_01790 [Ginsengibacter sp.]
MLIGGITIKLCPVFGISHGNEVLLDKLFTSIFIVCGTEGALARFAFIKGNILGS